MEKSKVALIVGSNRGPSFEVTRQLLANGFFVFFGVRRPESVERSLMEIEKFKENGKIIPLNVQDKGSMAKVVAEVTSYSSQLDVLINNASVLVAGDEGILTIPASVIERSLQANTIGPLLVCQHFLPLLLKSSLPRIINVSSSAGSLTYMEHWAPGYSISNTALNAVTKQLAWALKEKGVAVNAVCPGWHRVDLKDRIISQGIDEGAESIVWLATQAPQILTGMFIHDRKIVPW